MTRRLICALLALVLLAGLLPSMAMSANAASAMKTSDKAIDVIKSFEGFRSKAYLDNGGYSIGYGTRCEKDAYPNGISKEKADALLRNSLEAMEAYLNRMIDKYSLKLSQNQFDALMVFTYNLGTAWTLSDSDFRTAVIKGMTGNDFIFYITRWCNESNTLSTGLAKRRLAEADMYLNGYYSTKAPDNFTYVLFNVNGNGSVDYKIQGYDACSPVTVRATAYSKGYRFMGWYTKPEGGKLVTELDATTKEMTLYAHWQKDDDKTTGTITGSTVSYDRIASVKMNAYEKPSNSAKTVRTIAKGTSVHITADYIDANNVMWGKLSDGSWVKLSLTGVNTTADAKPSRPSNSTSSGGSTNSGSTGSATESSGITATITGNSVNYRVAPGTDQKILGSYPRGYKITVTEVKQIGSVKWGKFKDGWMCLTYTNYDLVAANPDADKKDDKEEVTPDSNGSTQTIATGTIINCGSLRYRASAGTSSQILGTIPGGTKVSFLEFNADKSWGRTNLGWICVSYVQLDGNTDNSGSGTTEIPDENTASGVTGWVTAGALNVRKEAGVSQEAVAVIPRDRKITITQQKTVGGVKWGKMELGWVCMDYILLDKTSSGATGNTGSSDNSGNDNGNGSTATQGMKGTVTASSLCVRSGAGMSYDVKSNVYSGEIVTVTEQKLVNGLVWGKIGSGWICMSYVKLDTNSGTVGFKGMVTASSLCVRSAAGATNAVVAGYVKGETIEIFETKNVDGASWGRTDKGWVDMRYVQ